MQERAVKNQKMRILWETEVKEIYGSQEEGVTGIRIGNRRSLEEKKLSCQGVFVATGHEPNTATFKGQLEMDERGDIASAQFPQTSVKGVFVAGDAFDQRFRQAITAAGGRCKAALAAQQYLEG